MNPRICNCPKCRRERESFTGEAVEADTGSFGEAETTLGETEEYEFALELLGVSSEAEMDQFLGKVFRGAWKGLRRIGSVAGKIAKPLGGVLKTVAKQALPFVGGALGTMIPIPGVGTMLGRAVGTALSSALEMETDGEDREFDAALRFVRLADNAARVAAHAPGTASTEAIVRHAMQSALRRSGNPSRVAPGSRMPSGRWSRHGRSIVVYGA